MASKLIAFAGLVAAASAGILHPAPLAYQAAHVAPLTYSHSAPLAYAAPVAKTLVAESYDHEYDSHPQYSYSYGVHDALTGDAKSQQETRNGDVVEGSYSLVEADGSRRVVHYTADDHNGFNAVVEKQPAQVAVKTLAPAYVKTVAPVATVYQHAAPVAHATYSAPALYHQHAVPVAHASYASPVLSHSYYH